MISNLFSKEAVYYNLSQMLPVNLKGAIKQSKFWLRHRCKYTNIYHCCVHKTASQWMQTLLCDRVVYQYSGLALCPNGTVKRGGYRQATVTENEAVPPNTIAGSVHVNFENFQAIPKPDAYRAFFVMRDPRDIVVSYYFSTKFSHTEHPRILRERKQLQSLSMTEGFLYAIECLENIHLFAALESWVKAEQRDPNIKLFRFEDLTATDNYKVFQELFTHCDIPIPEHILTPLLAKYSFENLTKGRSPGEENQNSHLRKGVKGDWQNYFNSQIEQKFREVTGDLVEILGY